MRINPTTSLNDAIKRMADKHTGAATVMGLLLKEIPEKTMGWLRKLDENEIYGADIWTCFSELCEQDIRRMLLELSSGTLKTRLESKKKSE